MKTSKKQTRLAQNSIDYIVYSSPDSVRKLLYEYGYDPPQNPHHLVGATKELIQKKGASIITDLLDVHPDKKAILALQKEAPKKGCNACQNDGYNEEDNFCGSCGHSNYNGSGDEDSFLDQFSDTSDTHLEKYYQKIVKKSNTNPEDKKLADEVQMVWNELRQRRLLQVAPKPVPTQNTTATKSYVPIQRDEIILMALSFLGGVVLCSVFKK